MSQVKLHNFKYSPVGRSGNYEDDHNAVTWFQNSLPDTKNCKAKVGDSFKETGVSVMRLAYRPNSRITSEKNKMLQKMRPETVDFWNTVRLCCIL
jgi:hypothetical protein